MTTDSELLAQFARTHSEPAFAELVQRHVNLVYSAALRQVNGDAHLAQDVAQTVFTDLAHKAGSLARRETLTGWLYTSAHFAAAKMARGENRRRDREEAFMREPSIDSGTGFQPVPSAPEPDWEKLRPTIDAAMHELKEADRDAILLRYFENQPFVQVGAKLGLNENAARMRVERALEKLRTILARRGITTATALASVVSANAVQAAPVGLATTLSTAAVLAGTAVHTSTVIATTKTLAMTTVEKTLVTATLAVVAGVGIYEANRAVQLHKQVQTLQQQQAPLAEQIQQLQDERDRSTNQLAYLRDELARSKLNQNELLRLRGEVTLLRRTSAELAALKSNSNTKTETEQANQSWLARVQLLKQKLESMPSQKNPENRFLTEDDWLQAAKHKLDTEDDYLAAFADLRARGEGSFLRTAEAALRIYLQTNNGVFPTELSQIKPYFDEPPSEEILQRYQIVPASNIPQANISGDNGGWLITLKAPDSGSLWTLSQNGVGGTSYEDSDTMAILAPAMKALMDATPPINGRKNITIQQLEPYLTTPEQKAAYQKLMLRSKAEAK